MPERKTIIKESKILSINRKCKLMEVNRSSLYYKPIDVEVNQEEMDIMKYMDKLHQKLSKLWGPLLYSQGV
jgi:hypothetical protein